MLDKWIDEFFKILALYENIDFEKQQQNPGYEEIFII